MKRMVLVSSVLLVVQAGGGLVGRGYAADGCGIVETTVDGVKQITMENRYVRLRFIPSRGGVCTSLFDKRTGTEWTTPRKGGGMFEDHVWQQSYRRGDWNSAAYVPKIIKRTPEAVELELAGQGRTGDNQFNMFRKRISLDRDSAAVRVRYSFEVGHDAMSAKTIGLWFHHSMAAPGQRITYYYPLKDGTRELLYDPAMPPEEYWEYNPTRGWIGAVSGKGPGLGCRMEYKRLMCFYQWFGQNLATLEWMFRNETIQNGASIETEIVLHPFSGLASVAGVGEGGVAGLTLPAAAAVGRPVSAGAEIAVSRSLRAGKVEWSVRRLPDLLWTPVRGHPLATRGPETARSRMRFTPEREGVFVVQVKVTDGGDVLVAAEKAVRVGEPSERYALLPEEKRIGSADERFGQRSYKKEDVTIPWTFKVATEHVPWAKPYYKGKIKALILMHNHNAREMIELAQRMDLDFDAPLITFGNPGYVGDAYGKIRPAVLNDTLKKHLSKKGYEVIVISGLNFKRLDAGLPDLLKKQVDQGVGLVYIAPWNRGIPGGSIPEILPIDISGNSARYKSGGRWRTVHDNPITRGVPVEALPPTGFFGYRKNIVRPGADVFLEVERSGRSYPLGIMRDDGGQRTVVFTYRASRIMAGHGDCLTPFIRYPQERFRYWEYHHAMLTRAILWAAKKDPQVSLEQSVSPAQPAFGGVPLSVRVRVAGSGASQLGASRLEVTLRDKYWRTVQSGEYELDPRAGRGDAALIVEKVLPVGTYFADCVLRCQGKSVAWGTLSFRIKGEERIGSFRLPGKINIFKTGDTVAAVAELVNVKPGATLSATLSDSLGREILRKDYPLEASPKVELKVRMPIAHPIATVGLIHIALKRAGQVVDEADVDFVTLPDHFASRVWDDYEIIPWGSVGAYAQGYLVPTLAKVLKDGGITVLYPQSSWTSGEDLRNEHESSVRAGFRVIEVNLWAKSYPKGYEEDRRNFQKTGDKKYLERKPSLSDPAYKQKMIEEVQKKANLFKRFSPLAWMWGDEQSVIGRIPVFDYDWSEPALKDFRKWLSREYGSLKALNTEWRTGYRTWSEVMPLTGSEARGQKNFAAWADHRTFMERSYVGFFEMLADTLNQACPNSKTGLSGTQVPSAYNGIDWSQFMKVFTYMQPYYNQGQAEMMTSFNPGVPRARWGGYGGTQQGRGAWADFLQGDMGRSFFALRSYINPDYTLTRSGRSLGEGTVRLRSGLAKLWSGVRPDFDPIGILYSQRSIQGGYLINRDWWRSHQAWFQALYSLGYNPRFVPYEELEQGEVTPARYKALILAMTVCISGREAAQIRKYAEAGGAVVGDFLVGAMDGHCQTASPGMLDSLFGIRRTGFGEKEKPEGALVFRGGVPGVDFTDLTNTSALPDADISLAGGKALGSLEGVPYAIFHRAGRGRTCYLNLDMSKYLGISGKPAGEFYRQIVARLVRWCRVGGPKAVVDAPDFRGRIYRQREGGNLYVGYMRPQRADAPWTVRFSVERRHVYDMLTGKYHGRVSTVRSEKSDNFADLFALLPYRVTGLAVTPVVKTDKGRATRGERVGVSVVARTAYGRPARHAARVTVTDPEGKEVPHYSLNLALPEGRGTFHVPFALNDRTGVWRLAVRDVVTGQQGEATIELTE